MPTPVSRRLYAGLLLAGLCTAIAPSAYSANEELLQCAAMHDDRERLKCYDDLASAQPHEDKTAAGADVQLPDAKSHDAKESGSKKQRSYLARTWNLDGRGEHEDSTRLMPLKPHRQNYLIVRETNHPNRLPYTPAVGAHAPLLPYDYDPAETKFQFSVKAEIMNIRQIDFLDFKDFRLWGAYTQQSNWQSFNTRNSSPFRETDYEPELIASFITGKPSGLKLVNLGLVHQSNGKSLSESRSWNRLYLQGGWEWNDISLLARGWWRIPENQLQDDNPDITNYLGHADAVLRWEPDKSQSVSLLVRNNLSLGQNRGFLQLEWATPLLIGKSAKLFVQATSGYGESLIDYNHRQSTVGMGVSFREW